MAVEHWGKVQLELELLLLQVGHREQPLETLQEMVAQVGEQVI